MRLKDFHICVMLACGLALLSLSCTRVETEDEDSNASICFTGLAERAVTRAEDPLPEDYTLWVQALYHVGDKHAIYFPEPKAFSCTGGIWKGADCDYYYPPAGSMDFLSFATCSNEYIPTATFVANGDKTAFNSMNLDFGTKLDGSVDGALYSEIKSGSCGADATILNLHFHHALSSVAFTARTEESETSQRFVIHNITLKNVKTSGAVDIAANTPVTDGSTVVMTWGAIWQQPLNGSATNLGVVTSESASTQVKPALLSSSSTLPGAQVGRTLYLPTQSNSPQAVSIDLKYSILNGTTYSSTQQHVITITLPAVQWLPEHQYTYTLSCSLTQITVSVVDSAIGAILDYTPESIDIDEQYHNDSSV